MNIHDIARMIDHTLLRPNATAPDVDMLIDDAIRYGFSTVIVQPCWVRHALTRGQVRVGSVIDFPMGCGLQSVRLYEARQLIDLGVSEIDMVINLGAACADRWKQVEEELSEIADVCHGRSRVVLKVILETAYLNEVRIRAAIDACVRAGADFVKTATGLQGGGATVADVRLMSEQAAGRIGVKAAGGIRSASQLLELIEAGAARIGASHSVRLMQELEAMCDPHR